MGAADACDPEPPIMRIIDVTSSDQDDDVGDGSTMQDAIFNDEKVCIRSERSGTEMVGRTYNITIFIADRNGNSTIRTITITVPHDSRDGKRCRKVVPGHFRDDEFTCRELAAVTNPPSEGDGEMIAGVPQGSEPIIGCAVGMSDGGEGFLPFTLLFLIALARRRQRFI